MTLSGLYDISEQSEINVFSFDMEECECFSLPWGNKCFIAIDPFKLRSQSDEIVKLAHEIGHCVTGSFYNAYSPLDIRAKHEYRANKWAIKKLVPKDELKKACKTCVNRYELSEYFGVTEDFMQIALEFYNFNLN